MSRGNGRAALFLNDEDRQAFLRLLAELPERFRIEVHAFVLMNNHYHLVVRTPEANLSHAIRWLQVSYSRRFNWAHRKIGHVFAGRFKSVVIQGEKGVCEVARYVHLNPVRIVGLGLGKEDRRRAKVAGAVDPGAELVARRLAELRKYAWSSWRVYSGAECCPNWLTTEVVGKGCGGVNAGQRRQAVKEYTEGPVRQGRLESPWERLVGGWVLGEVSFARALSKQASVNTQEQTEARRLARSGRVAWEAFVSAAERILGRRWQEMVEAHGDVGRDGVLYTATRYGGYRLAELLPKVPGLKYQAAAQGVRRFRQRLLADRRRRRLVMRLKSICK